MALFALGAASAAYGALMAVLYPAGGFFLAWIALGAALAALGWARRTSRWGRLAAWVRGLVVGCSAVVLLAVCALCGLVASAASATPPAGLDYLVVLGAGLQPDGTPSEALTYRLDAALDYLDDNPETTCLVSGGQGAGEVRAEADAMAEYLVAHGLDEGRLVREDRSTTTAENVRNSAGLVEPGATVAIVTNDFHLYRALRIAERNGLAGAHGLAAPSNPLYLPQAALRECAAIVKDALVGNI